MNSYVINECFNESIITKFMDFFTPVINQQSYYSRLKNIHVFLSVSRFQCMQNQLITLFLCVFVTNWGVMTNARYICIIIL